jgi:hypothetical protein
MIEQLFFFNLMVLIRSFIIAVRYGFTSKFRLSMLTKYSQDFGFISQDLLIPNWFNFNPDGLDLEIEGAIWRNLVEPETFKVSFIEELHPDMASRLSNKDFYKGESVQFQMKTYKEHLEKLKKQILKRRDSTGEIDLYNNDYDMFGLHSSKNVTLFSKQEKKFSGTLLLREIALFSGAHQRSTKLFLLLSIVGKLSLPFMARYYSYGTLHLEWDGIVYTVFEMLALSLFLLQNYFFIIAGHVDFQRRLFMIKSVGALINPFKESYDVKYQLFPTINLACKESVTAWF